MILTYVIFFLKYIRYMRLIVVTVDTSSLIWRDFQINQLKSTVTPISQNILLLFCFGGRHWTISVTDKADLSLSENITSRQINISGQSNCDAVSPRQFSSWLYAILRPINLAYSIWYHMRRNEENNPGNIIELHTRDVQLCRLHGLGGCFEVLQQCFLNKSKLGSKALFLHTACYSYCNIWVA